LLDRLTAFFFNHAFETASGVCLGKILSIHAREVLDSRGNPTVQVDVFSERGFGRATAPSGASTGIHEAVELRDGGKRFLGKGVRKAVSNVNGEMARLLRGFDVSDQEGIDREMCGADGTESKSRLGANATTAVSLAVAQCAASEEGIGLYRLLSKGGRRIRIPAPMMNVLNGGKHAQNGVALQEFMVFPLGFKSFSEALRAGTETYHFLSGLISKKYGKAATGLGDEGGFAPPCAKTRDALGLLEAAIQAAGYDKRIKIALDPAASSFYDGRRKKYLVDGKALSASELSDFYVSLCKEYPIISVEDPFEEEAFSDFSYLKKKLSGKVQIVGDDLLVTNVQRIKTAIAKKSVGALLLKVNQIGTLTEALDAAALCKKNGMGVVVSHRSGETDDTAIADIAVGIGCGQIKSGAPARGERTAKYNRLLQIEGAQESGFAGESAIVRR